MTYTLCEATFCRSTVWTGDRISAGGGGRGNSTPLFSPTLTGALSTYCSRIHSPWLVGIKSTLAMQGCRTGPPGYIGWQAGTTTQFRRWLHSTYILQGLSATAVHRIRYYYWAQKRYWNPHSKCCTVHELWRLLNEKRPESAEIVCNRVNDASWVSSCWLLSQVPVRCEIVYFTDTFSHKNPKTNPQQRFN